jgi:hypothetical protein
MTMSRMGIMGSLRGSFFSRLAVIGTPLSVQHLLPARVCRAGGKGM